MHRSMFISAGEFGQPLVSSVIARMFNCIQGDLDGFIAALEKAEFECRLPALSSLWADVRHENAQEILHNQLRVDGMYIQFPEYVSLPKGATVFRARSVSSSLEYGAQFIDQGQLWEPSNNCVVNFGRLINPVRVIYMSIAVTQSLRLTKPG